MIEEKQTNYQITERIFIEDELGGFREKVHTIKESNGIYAIFWIANNAIKLSDLPDKFPPTGSLLGTSGTSFLREIINLNSAEVETHARTIGISDTTIPALIKSLQNAEVLIGSKWTIPISESYVKG